MKTPTQIGGRFKKNLLKDQSFLEKSTLGQETTGDPLRDQTPAELRIQKLPSVVHDQAPQENDTPERAIPATLLPTSQNSETGMILLEKRETGDHVDPLQPTENRPRNIPIGVPHYQMILRLQFYCRNKKSIGKILERMIELYYKSFSGTGEVAEDFTRFGQTDKCKDGKSKRSIVINNEVHFFLLEMKYILASRKSIREITEHIIDYYMTNGMHDFDQFIGAIPTPVAFLEAGQSDEPISGIEEELTCDIPLEGPHSERTEEEASEHPIENEQPQEQPLNPNSDDTDVVG